MLRLSSRDIYLKWVFFLDNMGKMYSRFLIDNGFLFCIVAIAGKHLFEVRLFVILLFSLNQTMSCLKALWMLLIHICLSLKEMMCFVIVSFKLTMNCGIKLLPFYFVCNVYSYPSLIKLKYIFVIILNVYILLCFVWWHCLSMLLFYSNDTFTNGVVTLITYTRNISFLYC